MPVLGEAVVCVGNEALRAPHPPLVQAVLLDLTLLEHAEGLAGVVLAHDVFGIEDVAQPLRGEAIQISVVGVELGAQQRPPLRVPFERLTLVA